MTITTTIASTSYTGNGRSIAFATNFYFLENSHLLVTQTIGSVTATLDEGTDYDVVGAGGLDGGAVLMRPAPPNGAILTIRRIVPLTQETDYVQDDPFGAETHERGLDKLTMLVQQVQANLNSAIVAAGTGEVNTASNMGGGIGIYRQKVGADLQFRSISSPGSGSVGISVVSNRVEIDVKYLLSHSNDWPGGQQTIDYRIPASPTGTDHQGWFGIVRNTAGQINDDNMVALCGHVYHESTSLNATGAIWGLVTECWNNPVGTVGMIGAELGLISQHPTNFGPTVGINLVFKNRKDTATNPTAAVIAGPYYNKNSFAIFISSQPRPSGAGAAWGGVGSGWNSVIRVGDASTSGLDWEGGTTAAGAGLPTKNYTTIIDLTSAGKDMAGGYPWLALWRTGSTYFGIRFNAQITTGKIEKWASAPFAAGAGYAVNDVGNIGGGVGGTYKVTGVTAGAVTSFDITAPGTGNYVHAAATAATSGAGAGLFIDILQVEGERIEFWRMVDPGSPGSGGGTRYGFIDLAFTPLSQDGAFLKATQ